jgi:hypothetical protein
MERIGVRYIPLVMFASITLAISLVLAASTAFAQEWVDYKNIEEGFQIQFPGQPQVQQTTFTSQYGYKLPEKTFSVVTGPRRFSVTVVDYRTIEQQAIARACPQGKKENCPTSPLLTVIGVSEWRNDVRGAMIYALNRFTKRDAKIVAINGDTQDNVEGMMLTLENADKSRTAVSISMRDNRLYIVEGTSPLVGYPPPIAFQQSLAYLDQQGNTIRYQKMYVNGVHGLGDYPPPPVFVQMPEGR